MSHSDISKAEECVEDSGKGGETIEDADPAKNVQVDVDQADVDQVDVDQADVDQADVDQADVDRRKKAIMRTVAVVSVGFVCIMSAMLGLAVLQSSLHAEIGTMGLGCNNVATIFSCLLLSTYLVQKIGCKWAMVLGMACVTLWMASNFYVHWGTIIPAAIIMGVGMAPLWTAQCTLFTVIGVEYAKLTDQMPDVVIAKFFGTFFMLFMTGPIWGNMISAAILNLGYLLEEPANLTTANTSQQTWDSLSVPTTAMSEEVLVCGAEFCPLDEANITLENFEAPHPTLVFIVVSVYVVMGLLAMCIITLFLSEPLDKEEMPKFSPRLLLGTFIQLRNKYQVLLIPLTVYTGVEQAFFIADCTQAYITCALGVEMLGLVVICYAITAALTSLASGIIVEKTGRVAMFSIGFVSHLCVLFSLMFWKPDPDVVLPFFLIPIIIGVGDAICLTQLNALYSVLFGENSEAAFSNYRMWESVGISMSYIYSTALCVSTKLYIIMVIYTLGVIGYVITEVLYRREQRSAAAAIKQEDAAADVYHIAISRQTSRDSKDELGDSSLFHEYANYARRKSSVFVPGPTLINAAQAIRKKSNALMIEPYEDPSRIVHRKLSVFVPAEDLKSMT